VLYTEQLVFRFDAVANNSSKEQMNTAFISIKPIHKPDVVKLFSCYNVRSVW